MGKNPTDQAAAAITENARERIRTFAERIMRIEEEIKSVQDDRKEIYAEAKANGYDTKALKTCIRLMKEEEHKRLEREAVEATYRQALGIPTQLDMFDAPQADPSPIAFLGRSFDGLLKLAENGESEIQFDGRRIRLSTDERGSLLVTELYAPAKAA